MAEFNYRAVLFDLDGTLADTAHDLIAAVNRVRAHIGLPPADPAGLRPHASRGAAGLMERGLPELSPDQREPWRQLFLDHYRANCWHLSRPFPGIEALLDRLEAAGIQWGVVTNKLECLTRPILEQAGWLDRAGCVICGDSTTAPKPAPDPVRAACARLGVAPAEVVFIGDDRRDVDAGSAAGSATGVALWGYIEPGEQPRSWAADWWFESAAEVRETFDRATLREVK